ncbi:MAG: glycosyltransferase, partial [Verrucomicrobiaceae bacterium]
LLVTANAGGEDLVIEGETGFLVPIRSPEVLAAKIAWLADHRLYLETMREACREQAAHCTWQRYTARVLEALQLSQASMC